MSQGGVTTAGQFHTTHWSVVLSAGDTASPLAETSLAELCQAYWRPLYAYVRSRGHGVDDARDLTQQFFSRLLERNGLATADPARGRFRTFLLTSLQRFLVSEWRRETALRRDAARVVPLELEWDSVESRLTDGPAGAVPLELEFDRQWADALLGRALASLRAEHVAAGRAELLDTLEPFVWGRDGGLGHTEMAARLGLSDGAVRVAVHRLRARFRELLRQEVAATVASEDEVDAELRHLVEILVHT